MQLMYKKPEMLNAIANGFQSNKVHYFEQQKCKQTKIIQLFANKSRAAIPNNIATKQSLFSSTLCCISCNGTEHASKCSNNSVQLKLKLIFGLFEQNKTNSFFFQKLKWFCSSSIMASLYNHNNTLLCFYTILIKKCLFILKCS